MTEATAHRPSDEELDRLADKIADEFEGWVFTGWANGGIYSAEKIGTHPDRQAALTGRSLLQAIREREWQLTNAKRRTVQVITGARHTSN
jgi:hypothetical protein